MNTSFKPKHISEFDGDSFFKKLLGLETNMDFTPIEIFLGGKSLDIILVHKIRFELVLYQLVQENQIFLVLI